MVVLSPVLLAGHFPFLFPSFFAGDFVSKLVDLINQDGSLRVFCNNGAGFTCGLDVETVFSLV